MTVSSIVQGLLEKGHITAEEALVLLKAELNKTCCPITPVVPYNPPIPLPQNPFNPYVGDPVFPNQPKIWYTSGTHNPGSTINDNLTNK